MSECPHTNVIPEPCDQTLSVSCLDCGTFLAACWGEKHVPESLWNRACVNLPGSVPCDQNRDDVCAICGQEIVLNE